MCFYVRSLCCCCVSCMHCVRRRVAMLSIMSLLPSYTHTHKKKKKLVKGAFCCTSKWEVVTCGIRAGSTRDLGSLRISLI
jgi:hypothetical protein